MEELGVKELMSNVPVTLPEDASLAEITAQMSSLKLSCMIIVRDNKPVGIVTERDLVRYLHTMVTIRKSDSESVCAADIMTHHPVSIAEEATLFDALVLTQSRQIRHLPVIDEAGAICGILTYTDLANAVRTIIDHQSDVIDRSVEEKTRELRSANENLKALSMEDALLGIGNRRAMEVDLTYTHNTALRYNRPYSVALFDIDSFKQYNDHYGHQAGDVALRAVADHLKGMIRGADRLYRYGGEEILLLLPETPVQGAETLASRAVSELSSRQIPHVKSTHKVLTMSGGIGSPPRRDYGEDIPGWQETVEIADVSLYRAKRAGRNQIVAGDVL
jgi:diguanylate cyclase (GGDEF)-like protein